jgi:hypothetical protein
MHQGKHNGTSLPPASPKAAGGRVVPQGSPAGGGGGDLLIPREPTLKQRIVQWAIRGSITGFLLSLLVHLILLVVAAIWTIGVAQAGGSKGRDIGEIELAIASEAELAALEEASLEVQTPQIADASAETMPSPEVLEAAGDVGDTGVPGDIGEIADGMGAGGDIGDAGAVGEAGAGGGSAAFFGVEASGTRFAYVVDVSGSMQGEKLNIMKIELLESIDALLEHMHFMVCFYSTEAYPLGKKNKWTAASDSGKKWARDGVKDVSAYGGTNPLPGFQVVFNELTPRPDAIYFMTDGLFDPSVPGEIARINKRGKKVPIHCIAFDIQDTEVERMMKQIAEDSGGRYSAVPLNRSRK